MTRYKFSKYLKGIGSFAEVALDSNESDLFEITWSTSYQDLYYKYVYRGIETAMNWSLLSGGKPLHFNILDIQIFAVDTKPDAIRTASTIAAWIEMGNLEKDLEIIKNQKDEWKVIKKKI